MLSAVAALDLLLLLCRYRGPLVNGDGLLPSFDDVPARRVTVCYDYAEGGRDKFVETLYQLIW